ncbi:hypothetical protein KY334_05670 [Candidatus Woesearchaeota archaeon]|nr:hypothetical protein [Candidatus Woesearchaeota archaeon]
MVHNNATLHHHYHRSKKKSTKYQKILDKLVYAAGIGGPIMTIPQILKIWAEKTVAGVSLTSWSAYLIMAIIWLMYGIEHKEKPIIVTNALWVVFESLVVVGIIIYG